MITISLVDFQSSANCKYQLYTSLESFLEISYKFTGGKSYGFISDFGCGGWALTTCIGGRCLEPYTGKIFLNDMEVKCKELKNYSCFIGENIFSKYMQKNITTRQALEWALKISTSNYSVSDIKEMFKLSDGRFDRRLRNVGVEIWRISMAIGFALDRKIFCFPWVNQKDISNIEFLLEYINILKENGSIVLISSSYEEKLRKACDNLLIFKEGEILVE